MRFLLLLLQSIIQQVQMLGEELDEATRECMQQLAEYVSREMTRLLQEVEHRSLMQKITEQSSCAWGGLLLADLLQWQLWAIAGVLLLLLLFGLCWWLRKRCCKPGSSRKRDISRSLEEEEDGEDPLHMDRFADEYTSWPLPNRQKECEEVEELVNSLLLVCQILNNNFMPWLQVPVGLGGFREDVDACGQDEFVYRLLVPLEPPTGHSFHLELGTEGEMPVRNSRLRVQLECTCTEDWQPGDMLCYLHHSEDLLASTQEARLLQTLCTGPYLDVQKTALWLQELMTAACIAVAERDTYKFTVLPSTHGCKINVSNIFDRSCSIELILAVQHSDTFVRIE